MFRAAACRSMRPAVNNMLMQQRRAGSSSSHGPVEEIVYPKVDDVAVINRHWQRNNNRVFYAAPLWICGGCAVIEKLVTYTRARK
eukprot:UN00029